MTQVLKGGKAYSMANPTQTLEITELSEVSFVDAGDNPHAGVVLMKAKATSIPDASCEVEVATPATEHPSIVSPVVEASKRSVEARDEEMAKREEELQKLRDENAAFRKEREIESIRKRIAPLAPAIADDLYTLSKTHPRETHRLEAELLRLAKSSEAASFLTARTGDSGKNVPVAETVEDQIEQSAQEMFKAGTYPNIHAARMAAIDKVSRR